MKIEIRRRKLADVPVLEHFANDSRRLIFFQHGIFGDKDRIAHLLSSSFVKKGYHVVSVDARKHGARAEEPFLSKNKVASELELFDVVEKTALDIVKVHERFFVEKYSRFDILGVSMGAYVAYRTSAVTERVETLIALLGSPDFSATAFNGFTEEDHEKHQDRIAKERKRIDRMNPARDPGSLNFTRAILLSGKEDVIIPSKHTARFVEDLLGKDVVFRTYDTGHRIVRPMHKELLELLEPS